MQEHTKDIMERIKALNDQKRDMHDRRRTIDEQSTDIERQIHELSQELKANDNVKSKAVYSSFTFRIPEKHYRNFFAILNTMKEKCGFSISERTLFRAMISMIHENIHDSDIMKYLLIDRQEVYDQGGRGCYNKNKSPKEKFEQKVIE